MNQKYQKYIVFTNALAFGAYVWMHPHEHVDPMPYEVFPPDMSRVNITAVSTATTTAVSSTSWLWVKPWLVSLPP